ncbi:MAG: type II secretion system F family protein [Candidatus Omnitrophica bacterium]|nr:type II secretion system F family protein [Candidatus Omnitrophota bacterium]
MAYYTYKARDKKGKLITSQTFAPNKQELIKLLQKDDLLILSVKEAASIEEEYRRKLHRKILTRDLSLFAKELTILLENGVSIIEAFEIVLKQIESSTLLTTVKTIKKDLEAGSTLADAIKKYPRIFESFWGDMIAAGELSGQLPFVLRQVVTFLESRDEMRKKTIDAFMYPILLFSLAILTIVVFIFKVVPIFEELFGAFGAELPFFTSVIVGISNVIRGYFFVVVISAAVAGFLFKKAMSTNYGKKASERVLFNIPILGDFLLSLSLERFASTLSVLLKSGISIVNAMEAAVKTSQSLVFADRVDEARVKIVGGLPLSESLYQTNMFPPLAIQLVLVAEKTGNFSGMLEEVAKYYGDIVDTTMTRFTTLLGPVVLLFMALVIGGLIVAMFMPIFKFATLG